MKIEEIKDPIVFIALKRICKYLVNEIWETDLGSGEIEAEFKLAKERSKRYKKDVIKLSQLDTDINWGQKKTIYGSTKSWIISTDGNFNPWYKGKLTLEDLLGSLADAVEFEDSVDNYIQHAEFIHYYQLLKNYNSNDEINKIDDLIWTLINKEIVRVARSKYNSGYYADSVRTALVEIEDKVRSLYKEKTKKELSGDTLMRTAFSPKNPVIKLDDISTQEGFDTQRGYMDLFAGTIVGIRNPKSHRNYEIDREQAIHFLLLASLLMNKLDNVT